MTTPQPAPFHPSAGLTVAVAVMTYNAIVNLRQQLMEQTVESACKAFLGSPVGVFDNGSADGTADIVVERGGKGVRIHPLVRDGDPHPDNHTPGAGRRRLLSRVAQLRPNIFVLSDDDMVWSLEARDKLRRFWFSAPDDIVIVSGLLEPVWHWNTPRETVEYGGVKALVRDSAPGCAWTFRAEHLSLLLGLIKPQFGYDYEVCKELLAMGKRVAQMDLAEHAGWEHSTHGNRADQDAKPLDREKWGI